MNPIDVLASVRERYTSAQIPFLTEMVERVQRERPYRDLRILHNIPLTLEAILKIEPLILGGASVTITCFRGVPPRREALDILGAAGVPVHLSHQIVGDYDFHLDCGGQLISTNRPKIGAVELTQTGSEKYRRLDCTYPVISVDDSRVKCLETLYATGDGFVRGLRELKGNEIYDRPYVLVGYGKVGKGIAQALLKISADVTAIDTDKSVFSQSADANFNFIDGRKIEECLQAFRRAYCIVTATGVNDVMSRYYQSSRGDIGSAPLLANMGAADEWGQNFSGRDVLFEKKPLNFMLSEPTAIKYLDPIFYAHNLCIELLISEEMKAGYNPFPDKISEEILQKWASLHHESIDVE